MAENTPPAWTEDAANEILDTLDLSDLSFDLVSKSISRHAPDAEALADVLENISAELGVFLDMAADDAVANPEGTFSAELSAIVCYKLRRAITSHRARFPLVVAPVPE